MDAIPFLDSEQRQRAIALAVALASGTPLTPQPYERRLLSLFDRGLLTLSEVDELLELSIYQLIYHSRATRPPSEADLQHLLQQARNYNEQYQITGLLLYSHGRYVQVLEGAEGDVRAVYARIQQDPRHDQVVTLCQGPGPQRRFADWHMGFGQISGADLEESLQMVELPQPGTDWWVEDAHLRALLDAFGPHPLP
jgi:hypothetical protein